MANLTLRRVKLAPLTHNELDDNFLALDSDISQGIFDSGISVSGGINVLDGNVNIQDGNLDLNDGDIYYNPKLGFYDKVAGEFTFFMDSNGDLVRGENNIIINGIYIDSNAPTNPHIGDAWLNKGVNRLYLWEGNFWFEQP